MMSMHDRYYEPEDDDSDLLDERISELMKDEYDPSKTSNIAEAISEASANDQEIIRDFIENKAWDKLGAKLFYMTYEYMEKFAENHAQEDLSAGYLHD